MLSRFPQNLQSYGALWACYIAVMLALERVGVHLYLVTLGDDNPELPVPELPSGYEVRSVNLTELLPLAKADNGLSEGFLQGAIARGDRCIANFFHGQLVGYGFVALQRAPLTNQLDIVVTDKLEYRYKGWTHPDHRRKHLSHSRARLSRKLYPLAPGHRSVSYVATHNLASRLTRPELHPIRLGYCGYVRLFGTELPFTHRIPRRFGFSIERRDES